MTPAEAGNHRVVGDVLADDEAIARVAPAQPLDHPARPHTLAVGIDQQAEQNMRRERRLMLPKTEIQ